jgi:hypothetical protein
MLKKRVSANISKRDAATGFLGVNETSVVRPISIASSLLVMLSLRIRGASDDVPDGAPRP